MQKYHDADGYGEPINLGVAFALKDLTPGVDGGFELGSRRAAGDRARARRVNDRAEAAADGQRGRPRDAGAGARYVGRHELTVPVRRSPTGGAVAARRVTSTNRHTQPEGHPRVTRTASRTARRSSPSTRNGSTRRMPRPTLTVPTRWPGRESLLDQGEAGPPGRAHQDWEVDHVRRAEGNTTPPVPCRPTCRPASANSSTTGTGSEGDPT